MMSNVNSIVLFSNLGSVDVKVVVWVLIDLESTAGYSDKNIFILGFRVDVTSLFESESC